MPATIDQVTAEIGSGAPPAPAAPDTQSKPAGDERSVEERLRLAAERAQRLRAE